MASPDTLATMREQLAAAQADNRALRELGSRALEQWQQTEAERAPQDWHEHGPGQLMQEFSAILSRPPGSREALREMLAWAVSGGARAGEEGARTGRSETNESIVSRILGPEGGKA